MRGDMFFGTQDGIIMQADRTGYDDGVPYTATLVGGWEVFQSPSQTITWRQARASFSARAGEPFAPQLSATTDYVVTLPPPPNAGPDPGVLDLWDEGLWDDGDVGRRHAADAGGAQHRLGVDRAYRVFARADRAGDGGAAGQAGSGSDFRSPRRSSAPASTSRESAMHRYWFDPMVQYDVDAGSGDRPATTRLVRQQQADEPGQQRRTLSANSAAATVGGREYVRPRPPTQPRLRQALSAMLRSAAAAVDCRRRPARLDAIRQRRCRHRAASTAPASGGGGGGRNPFAPGSGSAQRWDASTAAAALAVMPRARRTQPVAATGNPCTFSCRRID